MNGLEFNGDAWIPSRYNIHAFRDDGKVVISNLFSGLVKVISKAVWERYLSPGTSFTVPARAIPETARRLFDQAFLVSTEIDELERVKLHFQQLRHDLGGQRVLIAPTMACNLHCPYCFEGAADVRKPMARDVEEAVAKFVIAQSADKEELIVNWFGGEPLLRMDTIERISTRLIDVLPPQGVRYVAQITTNGLFLDDDIIQRLRTCQIRDCQITVDVPKSNKQDVKGEPVLLAQLDRIAQAAEAFAVKLRVNVSRDDVREFDQLYEELIARGLHNSVDRLHITLVLPVENAKAACGLAQTQSDLKGMLRRERDKARDLGFPVNEPLPSMAKPCGATCITQTLIDPDGLLYKCPSDLGMQARSFGSVFQDRPTRAKNLLPWLTYDWFQYDDCRGCKMLPRCAGGCPHRRMHGYAENHCLYDPSEVDGMSSILLNGMRRTSG